jgi:hypothetical protein
MRDLTKNESGAGRKNSLRRDCFTPCKRLRSLLEPMTDAVENVAQLAAISLSPARSSFDRFQNSWKSGEKLYRTGKSISWGEICMNPNRNGQMSVAVDLNMSNNGKQRFSLRGFLREKHGANHPIYSTSLQKGRQQRESQ